MAQIHLIIGPVGAGKSTFARKVSEHFKAVRFTLDEWMAVLFGQDERPADRAAWYIARTERCLDLIWRLSLSLLAVGTPVVLEVGLIRREARNRLYGQIDAMACDLVVYCLDAGRSIRRERVLKRNIEKSDTFSMEVPLAFFEIASDMWEPPDEIEKADREMRFISTD